MDIFQEAKNKIEVDREMNSMSKEDLIQSKILLEQQKLAIAQGEMGMVELRKTIRELEGRVAGGREQL